MTTVRQIQESVAGFYGLTRAEMLGRCRKRKFARPRQISMFVARAETKSSLPLIGRLHGGMDHTTVLHSVQRIAKLREEFPHINHAIETASRLAGLSYQEWTLERDVVKALVDGLRGLPVGSYSWRSRGMR